MCALLLAMELNRVAAWDARPMARQVSSAALPHQRALRLADGQAAERQRGAGHGQGLDAVPLSHVLQAGRLHSGCGSGCERGCRLWVNMQV